MNMTEWNPEGDKCIHTHVVLMVYCLEKGKVCDESCCHFWLNAWQGGCHTHWVEEKESDRRQACDEDEKKMPEIILGEITRKGIYVSTRNGVVHPNTIQKPKEREHHCCYSASVLLQGMNCD